MKERNCNKKVYGYGINDLLRMTKHPAYRRWTNMLMRCYCEKYKQRFPTYIGCSVCDEWLTFSNFYSWWLTHNVEGWDLEKDIIFPGNKVYSPDTVIMVRHDINLLFTDHTIPNGLLPGVKNKKRKSGEQYLVQIVIGGELCSKHFSSEEDAHQFYNQKRLLILADLFEHEIENVYNDAANDAGTSELAENIREMKKRLLKRLEEIIIKSGTLWCNNLNITDLFAA